MIADSFLDANILVYAFDQNHPAKRDIALSLIRPGDSWAISWQVVQEFCSVGLHKFEIPLTPDFLEDFLTQLLWPHTAIFPSPALYSKALKIHTDTRYRFYDCLVVAAALYSGAPLLYSEDLQHDRRFGDLRIVNPFL